MPETLDSSRRFLQENYKGRIKEVTLMGSSQYFQTLEGAVEIAREEGHCLTNMTILNIVHGEPSKNEPAEAILLKENGIIDGKCTGLIVKRYSNGESYFELYTNHNGFRFIA